MNVDDPDELIIPAVQGAVNLLSSAKKYGTRVKRVVLTSSCTAIATPGTEGTTVDERDWNEWSIKEVRTKGREAHGLDKNRASKTLSERAAWDWYEEHKQELGWDIVVLNPSLVLGPWLHKTEKFTDLGQSLRFYHSVVVKGEMSKEVLADMGCAGYYRLTELLC